MEQWVNGRHNTDLAGKTAVITGGGSGIGRAIAHLFALEGARIISVDIDARTNVETARIIRESGGLCEPLVCSGGILAAGF